MSILKCKMAQPGDGIANGFQIGGRPRDNRFTTLNQALKNTMRDQQERYAALGVQQTQNLQDAQTARNNYIRALGLQIRPPGQTLAEMPKGKAATEPARGGVNTGYYHSLAHVREINPPPNPSKQLKYG